MLRLMCWVFLRLSFRCLFGLMTTRISRQWQFDDSDSIRDAAFISLEQHFSPLLAQLLHNRGLADLSSAQGFLDPDKYHPAPPSDLPDLLGAVDLLAHAISTQQRILVWGDFDVDGQTATALLVDGLQALGATVTFYIPHRLRESHGIQLDSLQTQIKTHAPDLLLTCDTGISAHEAINLAMARGLTVIITDHHDLPPDLPQAHAVINPKRLPEEHPLRSLPGVGVAFKLMEGLYSRLKGHDSGAKEVTRLLDLVALGIVADVAELIHDTRYLLQIGLRHLQRTPRVGLKTLFEVSRISSNNITAETIGFQIGPRLNAAGRLDDATPAVKLLLTESRTEALVIARQLDGLNSRRRVMQREIYAAALQAIADNPQWLDLTALVIYQPGWHPGILGIVAGQMAEKFGKPCVLLTSNADGHSENNDIARGSARSVPGYNIGAAIAAHADILVAHGGHAGAAGLALHIASIDQFRRRLSATLDQQFRPDEASTTLKIDATISFEAITPDLVDEVHRLAPFGEGNPAVLFATRGVTLEATATVGVERLHRRLTVKDTQGAVRNVLWWNSTEHPLPEGRFDIAYTLAWNIYRDQREIALTLVDYRIVEPPAPDLARPTSFEIVDWRARTREDIEQAFGAMEPTGLVWAEGANSEKDQHRRHVLRGKTAEALLVLTIPPSRAELRDMVETVGARRIYLGGIAPDTPQQATELLQLIAGMCRYAISRNEGRAELDRMAGRSAQTLGTVVAALRHLEAKRTIDLQEEPDTVYLALPTDAPRSYNAEETYAELRRCMAETQAYRKIYLRMDASNILA